MSGWNLIEEYMDVVTKREERKDVVRKFICVRNLWRKGEMWGELCRIREGKDFGIGKRGILEVMRG